MVNGPEFKMMCVLAVNDDGGGGFPWSGEVYG